MANPLRYLDKSGVTVDKLEEAAADSKSNPFLVTKRGSRESRVAYLVADSKLIWRTMF